MSSKPDAFVDPSGGNPDEIAIPSTRSSKVIPQALNLQQEPSSVYHRDSGCYSASPFSANMTSSSIGSKTRFQFSCSHSPSRISSTPYGTSGDAPSSKAGTSSSEGSIYNHPHSTPSSEYGSVKSCSSRHTTTTHDSQFTDDDSDEVFEMSVEEPFADSGVQELMTSCHLSTPIPTHCTASNNFTTSTERRMDSKKEVTRHKTQVHQLQRTPQPHSPQSVGFSTFYLPSTSSTEQEEDGDWDDDDSSTPQESSSPNYDLPKGSPTSSPINIPARSSSSSPTDGTVDETDGISFSCPATSSDGGSCSPALSRVGLARIGMTGRPLNRERPSSDRPLAQGNGRDHRFFSMSTEGATGPLPDVVPPGMRNRAMSESAIYNSQMTQRVGISLRNMCDEFSEQHFIRRENINQLRQIQQRCKNRASAPAQRPFRPGESPKAESILDKLLKKK